MGDRSNIVVEVPNYELKKGIAEDAPYSPDNYEVKGFSRVWLYGHWMGPRAIDVAAEVIEQGDRLTDDAYLARILFCRMIGHKRAYATAEEALNDTLSYGISTRMADNEYPIIVFHVGRERTELYIEDHADDDWRKPMVPVTKFMSPERFLEAAKKAKEAGRTPETQEGEYIFPSYEVLIDELKMEVVKP